MVVRPAAPTDHIAVRDVVTLAFGDEGQTVAALVDDLRASGHARASWSPRSRARSWAT